MRARVRRQQDMDKDKVEELSSELDRFRPNARQAKSKTILREERGRRMTLIRTMNHLLDALQKLVSRSCDMPRLAGRVVGRRTDRDFLLLPKLHLSKSRYARS